MTSFAEARGFLLAHRDDYQTAAADFRWPDPVPFNWALDWFDAVLARAPESRNRPALEIVDAATGDVERRSFADLSTRSNVIANRLRAHGLRRGDRILMMLGNTVPLWEIMLAAMKLGAVVIPATTLLTAEDAADRISRGGARFVVTSPEHAAKIPGEGLVRILVGGVTPIPGWHDYEAGTNVTAFEPDGITRADDPMLIYFTSGTTAKPKRVMHSHYSYPVGHLSTMYWLGLRPGDRHLNISSPGWAKHAWSCFFAPWNAGAGIFIVNMARFEAGPLLDIATRYAVTTLCAPPTVWRMLAQEDLRRWQTHFRELAAAGEPLNPEIIAQFRSAWGLTIRDGYGQTETTAQIGNPPGQALKPGSMGRPLPGYRVALLDLDDQPAREGEICLPTDPRPAGLMLGYQGDDGAALPVVGIYRTGDVATIDDEGYLTFVGRTDDVFKSSDYRISPFELESVLIEHPSVVEAAVVPSPDPLRLAVPKAYVTLAAGVPPDRETALSIFRHTHASLAPYKRLRRIEFAPELPKTISGKIRRTELRARETNEKTPGLSNPEFISSEFPELKVGNEG